MRGFHLLWVVTGVLGLVGAARASEVSLEAYEVTPLELRGEVIRDIEVHPTEPNIVFLIGAHGGVYRSDDHGDNWTNVLRIDGRGMGIDHRNPETIYAGGFGGIYRSDDGGETWRQVLDEVVRSVGVHPVSGVVFGGGNRGVVYRSDDGGETWTEPERASDGEINKWAFHPMDDRIVYHSAAKNRGVYMSRDGGESFEQVLEGYGRCVSLAPSDPDVLYSSRFMSRDGGETWDGAGGGSAWAVAINPNDSNIVYKATQGDAVYVTHNGGRTWRLARGLRRGGPTDLTAHWSAAYDGENDIVYIGAAVLYKAHNASSPDAELVEAGAGIIAPRVRTLDGAGAVAWAGTDGQGVVRSTDFGRTWERKLLGLRSKLNLGALSIHPSDNDIIYAAGEGGLVRTTSGGEVWMHLPSPGYVNYGTGIVLDPQNVDRVWLLSGRSEGSVYVSEDGGYGWSRWGPLADREDVRRFVKHPTLERSFIIQTEQQYLRSDDGGETWEAFTTPSGGSLIVSARPETPDVYYAVRDQQGVWRSEDAGANWTRIVEGGRLGTGRLVEAPDGTIWLGRSNSLERSADGGETWQSLEMPDRVNAVLVAPTPDAPGSAGVLVGLQGGLVWAHPPGMTFPPAPAPTEAPRPEHRVVEISAGGVLDRPNTTYRLTTDVTSPATAFFVTADDVTLDGQGHAVIFDHCGVEAVGVRNLTVRDISLTQSGERRTSHGTAHGMDLTFCDDVTISGVTVRTVNRSSGAIVVHGERARIEQNVIAEVGDFATGITVTGPEAQVRGNRITATSRARGLIVNESAGAVIEANEIEHGGSTGITGVVISASDGVVFRDNTVEGNARSDPMVVVSFTDGFTIDQNVLRAHSAPVLRIDGSSKGRVSGNRITAAAVSEYQLSLRDADEIEIRDNALSIDESDTTLLLLERSERNRIGGNRWTGASIAGGHGVTLRDAAEGQVVE